MKIERVSDLSASASASFTRCSSIQAASSYGQLSRAKVILTLIDPSGNSAIEPVHLKIEVRYPTPHTTPFDERYDDLMRSCEA